MRTKHWPGCRPEYRLELDETRTASKLVPEMRSFKIIRVRTTGLFKQACRLPHLVATALDLRRRRFALNALEAERFDRIHEPSRYPGK
jgi:hypothetical protein